MVREQLLGAGQPVAPVQVALVIAERAELEELRSQKLERAEYEADRARRCYHLAEPENRLVVRQLERERETSLANQQKLREEHDRFTRTSPASSPRPSGRPSPLWPVTSPGCGMRRPPRSRTARRSSARSSTRSSSR
ncbi:hypothetical protein [Streptomyces sporangiiformans]|uniref:hypothetical protein n=1 Tax=Streptomyces sporangiiformans TaxID=2315329 RepID=UPI0013C4A26F|nr:hypothetical protein [Streptomyces sporangiiformans]